MSFDRRHFLKASTSILGATTLHTVLAGCAGAPAIGGARPKVVVVGAGFGGATFVRYLKRWSPQADITLIEANGEFLSCPLSNMVLAGINTMEDITLPYDGVRRAVDDFVQDTVVSIDTGKRKLLTQSGNSFSYDKLILCGGVELMPESISGYDEFAQRSIKHAWKASPEETGVLRRQLESMPDGGTFLITVPMAPYRCHPAPYERACLVGHYFKHAKPKSKIIILDSNPDITAMKGLFLSAWKKHYNGMIEWRSHNAPRRVGSRKMEISTDFDDVKGDVINIIPPMRAAKICALAGVRGGADGKDGAWCAVDYRSFESSTQKDVHILGDSAHTPFQKAGSVANNTAKLCAYALSEQFAGRSVDPAPVLTNSCYSASTDSTAFHVATVFRWNDEKKTMLPEKNANGVSKEESELEFAYMESWTKNIWADTLGL